jgi:hypothetical protein
MNETRCAQTTFISDPFSAKRKLLRPQRKFKVKNNPATEFMSKVILLTA